MDIKIFRPPTGQDHKYPKVERVKEDGSNKQKKDDGQQQKKKKKDEKIDGIFSSLAENLYQDDNGY